MSLLKPGALPRPLSAAARRREQAGDEAAAARQMAQRPNVPPEDDARVDRCTASKYQQHRFVVVPGGTACEFCHRSFRECRR